MSEPIKRREFLTTAAAVAAASAVPRRARAQSGSAAKIRVAVMGTNGRGAAHAKVFASLEGSEVTTICDVDPGAIKKGVEVVKRSQEHEPRGVTDIHKVLSDPDVDVISIAAPNHWHAPATIMACQAGKHVYVEKPCSHNPREGELMVAAARKHKRVVQMGNQRRSYPQIMEAMRRLHEGVIGRVYHSRCWYNNLRPSIGIGKAAAVPAGLDYDLWQGPAPRKPFRDNYLHYNWHWFWHWGNGELGNNGVHSLDICRWGMGVDYPIRVTSSGGRYHWSDDQQTPDTHIAAFEFEGRKSMIWHGLSCNKHHVSESGVFALFHGENGSMAIKGSGYLIYDQANKLVEEVDGKGSDGDHFQNFLDAIRNGTPLNSEIEEGHKSTLLCHLGNIAYRTGRALTCDPANGRIIGDAEAMKQWKREYEPGWEPVV